jgi:L-asparagine transporter-like permease
MLLGLGFGLLLPRVYLFLVSSGGFALLFTYTVIIATHIKFRKKNGCPPDGKCQMPGYPYTSWIVLSSMIIVIVSMPLIPGQRSGLIAGIIMTAAYSFIYFTIKLMDVFRKGNTAHRNLNNARYKTMLSTELSRELTDEINKDDKNKQ